MTKCTAGDTPASRIVRDDRLLAGASNEVWRYIAAQRALRPCSAASFTAPGGAPGPWTVLALPAAAAQVPDLAGIHLHGKCIFSATRFFNALSHIQTSGLAGAAGRRRTNVRPRQHPPPR